MTGAMVKIGIRSESGDTFKSMSKGCTLKDKGKSLNFAFAYKTGIFITRILFSL